MFTFLNERRHLPELDLVASTNNNPLLPPLPSSPTTTSPCDSPSTSPMAPTAQHLHVSPLNNRLPTQA
ncbi:hypothetical protein K443DRAFT_12607 [Laccaria amethystina LaAM-08-1]|uniref:Unplaced genomic scaffold K443scaffold_289, whole genome shotgun sequence n=1 Tax=Laccaria amethystina LaAM-08-1 TaxID=1095629 RepID=A0A0C9X834_9AGAR|nr:hypothetical protein K443DRAFT_12607 [Laccaria amethystina LaAM-08-1]